MLQDRLGEPSIIGVGDLRPSFLALSVWTFLGTSVLGCTLQDFDALSDKTLLASTGPDSGAIGADAGWQFQGNGGSAGAGGGSGSAGLGGSSGGSADAAVPEGNLFVDPSFEDSYGGWIGFGNSALFSSAEVAHLGTKSIQSINRTQSWEGPTIRVDTLTSVESLYRISAWVRAEEGNQPIGISLKTVCEETGETYGPVVSAVPTATEWTFLEGVLTLPQCELREASIYFEGPAPGSTFYVDDVSLMVQL